MNFPLGASYLGEKRCHFQVWAPRARKAEVHLVSPAEQTLEMHAQERGYYCVLAEDVEPGSLYYYRLDAQTEVPDPASRFQPRGVHGPSAVVDQTFAWSDASWKGLDLRDYIFYEAHVGTFTEKGTFEAMVPCLDGLRDLGFTALELMPVGQFPGARNWGYDGAYPYATQNSYGGPAGLMALVDACHACGLAVVLDVVYNHLGPEGNYLGRFGHYFTDRYRTPWGPAVNFDGRGSDEVRRFFIENALYWVETFHIDALRLDAIHAIVDPSARPFLEELGVAVHQAAKRLERKVHVIAESDRNDSRLIRDRAQGGYGLDAQWNDDLHHALHALLTDERNGYYCDFGRVEQLAAAYREGYIYSGQYSEFRQRRHGNASKDLPSERFVVFAQNHDQVGNRMLGERLSRLVSFEALKLAAGVVLLSPFLPLLFMGEEYGENAPFQYFVSHSDPKLIEAVRKGRQEEFAAFQWTGKVPDPQAEETFRRSVLHQNLRREGKHRVMSELVRELIGLRKTFSAPADRNQREFEVVAQEREKLLWVRHSLQSNQAIAGFNFGEEAASAALPFPVAARLDKMLDSADQKWLGGGSRSPGCVEVGEENSLAIAAKSFILYHSF